MNTLQTEKAISIFFIAIIMLLVGIGAITAILGTPRIIGSAPAIKIAIIDTGLQLDKTNLKLCPTGHFNFATNEPVVGVSKIYPEHGTLVASIIADNLKRVDYCAIIYQVSTYSGISVMDITRAAKMALKEEVTAVNLSISGNEYSREENAALYDLLDRGAVFVAAGNDHIDLSKNCSVYPACYSMLLRKSHFFVVGALDDLNNVKALYSNYGEGRIDKWDRGMVVWNGTIDQGTSYATPRSLSKYVLSLVAGRTVAIRKQPKVQQQ